MPVKNIKKESIAYKFYINDDLNEKTFENENLMPDLPVPLLEDTIEKYLKSVRPFTSDQEFNETYKIAKEFKNGIGKELQQKLLERAGNTKNWLEEWWLKYCYLSLRSPLSPTLNMAGIQSLHFTIWNDPKEENAMERSAISLWAQLQFYILLREERLKPQFTLKGTPLSMNQFRYLYNTSRIPNENIDELMTGFKTKREGDCPQHIIVLCHGHIWILNPWDNEGDLLDVLELEKQLIYVQNMSQSLGDADGLAALTCDYREVWAKNRRWLASLSQRNATNLSLVESAVSIASIDNQTPKDFSEAFDMSLCGNPINRWADKSYVAIGFKNGYFTSTNDHTPYDAMVSVVIGHFQHALITEQFSNGVERVPLTREVQMPIRLQFDLDDLLLDAIEKAKQLNNTLKQTIEAIVFTFPHFGKDFMKEQGLHPDSFIQCALQLAYYKLHKKFAPTYETATTREFYHARTETVRSCTEEIAEWVKSMVAPDASVAERKTKMKYAIEKHLEQMRECQKGQGIDRHLFGLAITAMEAGTPMPNLFTDPAFTKSGGGGNYVLSTSTIGYTNMIGGVSAMVENGYGIFYGILPERLQFTMTDFKGGETSIDLIKESIKNTLLEMQKLCNEVTSKI